MPKGKSCKPSATQLSAQALTVASMYQKLSKQLNFAMHSTALVKPYENLASGLGSHLQQAVSCGYGIKSLTSHIKPIPTRALIPGIASSVLSKNIIDNCIVVPTNISKEISDTLGIADNNFEAAIPYNDSKKVSIDTFALYLTIISSIVGICMSFLYTPYVTIFLINLLKNIKKKYFKKNVNKQSFSKKFTLIYKEILLRLQPQKNSCSCQNSCNYKYIDQYPLN